MLSLIESFFCSISAFFFKYLFTFVLFIAVSYLIYNYFIKRFNRITNILYFIFLLMVTAGGIVLVLLPSKENVMSPHVITSYYLAPLQLIVLISLFISILLSTDNSISKKVIKKKVTPKKEAVIQEVEPVKKEVTIQKKEKIVPKKTSATKKVNKTTTKKVSKPKTVKKTK